MIDGVQRLLAGCLIGVGLAPTASHAAQPEFYEIDLRAGPLPYMEYVGPVSGVGDLDGDGRDEIAIRVVLDNISGNPSTSFVRVFSGATLAILVDFDSPDVPGESTLFGVSFCGIGDIDGDGTSDVIVGYPGWDDDKGAAYVFSGASGERLRDHFGADHGAFTWHDNPSDTRATQFGAVVDHIGDTNGDGVSEYIVGSRANAAEGAYAWVFDGATSELFSTADAGRGKADGTRTAAGVGDVNGDGTPDYAVSMETDEDTIAVPVYSGADHSILHTLSESEPDHTFGYAVCGVGDLDLDGKDDVLVTAPYEPDVGGFSGLARVYSGQTGQTLEANGVRYEFLSSSIGAWNITAFGYDAGSVHDVDGDGVDDFIIGAPGSFPLSKSTVYVLSGATGEELAFETAVRHTSYLGRQIAGVGDVNGDGLGDFAAVFAFRGAGSKYGEYFVRLYRSRPCPADANDDGAVTPADYNAWILAYNDQSQACDQNRDGLCTPADYNAWILNFNTGCP